MVMMAWEGSGLDSFRMQLERFQDNIKDAKPAFEAMADRVAESNREEFNAEGGTRTGPWAALSPKYEAWKSQNFPGQPTMVRSGDLKDSLTNRPFGIDEVTERGMTVGTDVPYAKYHQHGTGNMPQRQLVGDPSMNDKKAFAKILQRWIVERETTL